MNARERGFLLLTSRLGNPKRKPLTVAQFRVLASRIADAAPVEAWREIEISDLMALGYGNEMAWRIVGLLQEEKLLERYLCRGKHSGCVPLTRVTEGYPLCVRKRLGLDSPGCLWAKGDLSLLGTPKISLIGSRALQFKNQQFAREAGRQAALQGYTLVSGNAVGADSEAQKACLDAGGCVIGVVADALEEHPVQERVLFLAEDGFDEGFLPQRALSRNRVIHSLGEKTLVAQCSLEKGGSWDGAVRNLRFGWSPLFCFQDGSEAMTRLEQMGAALITIKDLNDLWALKPENVSLFDQ